MATDFPLIEARIAVPEVMPCQQGYQPQQSAWPAAKLPSISPNLSPRTSSMSSCQCYTLKTPVQ